MSLTKHFYSGDTVCYLDDSAKLAYIGTVLRSDKITPDLDQDLSMEEGHADEVKPFVSETDLPVSESCQIDKRDLSSRVIKVEWTSLTTGEEYTKSSCPISTSLAPEELRLLEREHALGDAVRHSETDAVGTIVKIHNRACVELLSHRCVAVDIDCKRLRSVNPWSARTDENYVVWNGWLGQIVACHMMAVVRFIDGARLLVREECLRDFDPIAPTSDSWPDKLCQGAYLRGDAYEFKQTTLGVYGPKSRDESSNTPANRPTGDSTLAGRESSGEPTTNPLPPSHPSSFQATQIQPEDYRGSAARDWHLMERSPVFLTETEKHNAFWLSRLHSSTYVSVYVEHFIPAEVTVQWFTGCAVKNSIPPRNVVRGSDLANLLPVMPYAYHGCTTRDIWYYQLTADDAVHDLKRFSSPEHFFYNWLSGNQSVLAESRLSLMPCNDPSTVTSKVQKTVVTSSETTSIIQKTSAPTANFKPTTPYSLQRTLFRLHIRKYRVIRDPRHPLNLSEVVNWNKSRDRDGCDIFLDEVFSVDIDTDNASVSSRKTSDTTENVTSEVVCPSDKHQLTNIRDRKISSYHSSTPNDTETEVPVADFKTQADTEQVTLPANDNLMLDSDTCVFDDSTLTQGRDKPKRHRKKSRKTSGVSNTNSEHVQAREAQLPVLQADTWVPVGIYFTCTTYDVRWQDGSLGCKLSRELLFPVHFDIDEHDFLPGNLVSRKKTFNQPNREGVTPTSDSADGSFGVVLSTNPKERVCLVRWFQLERNSETDSSQLIPRGDPEEVGVYELASSTERQVNYGEIMLMNNTSINRQTDDQQHKNKPQYPPFPAGYIEDILPDTGHLVVRWADGSSSSVLRTDCLLHLDSWVGDYSTDDEASDNVDTDQLTSSSGDSGSDYDSEWETVSEATDTEAPAGEVIDKSTANDTQATKDSDMTTPLFGDGDDYSDVEKINDGNILEIEENTQKAVDLIVSAYRFVNRASSFFADRRSFVFWTLRRFIMVPDELDTTVDQLGALFAAAANLPHSSSNPLNALRQSSTVTDPPKEEGLCGNLEPVYPFYVSGRLLNPALPWSFTEDTKATNIDSSLYALREQIRQAYKLVKDYRMKKLYSKCYPKDVFVKTHVESILKALEVDEVASALKSSLNRFNQEQETVNNQSLVAQLVKSNDTFPVWGEQKSTSCEIESSVSGTGTAYDTRSCSFIRQAANTIGSDFQSPVFTESIDTLMINNGDSFVRLRDEILVAMRLNKMKVLVVPDDIQPFAPPRANWHTRIHYSVVRAQTDSDAVGSTEPAYYTIVSGTLFNQLNTYLSRVHNHLQEQLTDFCTLALAWLGEISPDAVAKATAPRDPIETDSDVDDVTMLQAVVADGSLKRAPADNSTSTSEHGDSTSLKHTDSSSREPDGSKAPQPSITSVAYTNKIVGPAKEVQEIPALYRGIYKVEDEAPLSHKFYKPTPPSLPKAFYKAWKRDTALLSTSLPRGIVVKAFADRIDLYSVLIVGTSGTPYEHGLFLFDVQLPSRYPFVPPSVHYYSFASERINPNLYVDGHVCLSLIGTWSGVDSENWKPEHSNLLQLVVSLQGLILNSEPYFNEAGFENCRGKPDAHERSRVYNESVVVTLIQSSVNLLLNVPPVFETEILQHFLQEKEAYTSLLTFWITLDEKAMTSLSQGSAAETADASDAITSGGSQRRPPEFPMAPVSRGFQISVRRHRDAFLRLLATTEEKSDKRSSN